MSTAYTRLQTTKKYRHSRYFAFDGGDVEFKVQSVSSHVEGITYKLTLHSYYKPPAAEDNEQKC
jgi:hypothetical protein